jgi:Raf kinase inhibitor-like YbhB/YbcL family protein
MTFALSISAFTHGGWIPAKFTCEGVNVSPELRWSDAPAGAKSFALIVDDPDAPVGTFTHWVLFDLPADQASLTEGVHASGVAGKNDFGRAGYGGPCPPRGHGPHRYYFTLYALNIASLKLKTGADRRQVETALRGHTLAQAQYLGRYERK